MTGRAEAMTGENLDVLQTQNSGWIRLAVTGAAVFLSELVHRSCCRWSKVNDCPWDGDACEQEAENEDIKTL